MAAEVLTRSLVSPPAPSLAQDDDFKFELLDFGFPERLGICIGSGDVEVAHWAIVIVHDMAMLGLDACLQIIEASRSSMARLFTTLRCGPPICCTINLPCQALTCPPSPWPISRDPAVRAGWHVYTCNGADIQEG